MINQGSESEHFFGGLKEQGYINKYGNCDQIIINQYNQSSFSYVALLFKLIDCHSLTITLKHLTYQHMYQDVEVVEVAPCIVLQIPEGLVMAHSFSYFAQPRTELHETRSSRATYMQAAL